MEYVLIIASIVSVIILVLVGSLAILGGRKVPPVKDCKEMACNEPIPKGPTIVTDNNYYSKLYYDESGQYYGPYAWGWGGGGSYGGGGGKNFKP